MKYAPDENVAFLRALARPLGMGTLKLANRILNDPKFSIWSASSHPNAHHYGNGGLAQHTREVVELCMNNNSALGKEIDEVELYLAALYHDYGKIWDYCEKDGAWVGTPHKRLIHHISRSGIEWSSAIRLSELDDKYDEPVLHAILAHHGQREWGSPVAPKSKAAWMLHLCDGISARMNDADTLDVLKRPTQI